jgi:3,4-dihydroxy 2-butanone 4-phosphate synthase/GTP cyclohydrolase II
MKVYFVMVADFDTPESMVLMIRNGSRIILVGMKEEDLERLMLAMMFLVTEIGNV